MKRRSILIIIILVVLALIMAIVLRGSTQTFQNLAVELQRRSNCGSGYLRLQPNPNRSRASDIHSNSDADRHGHIDQR